MFIPKAICGADGAEMIITGTGLLVEMIASWGSYYKIYGDQYSCVKCANSVVLLADMAATAHFESAYAQWEAPIKGTFADNNSREEPSNGKN